MPPGLYVMPVLALLAGVASLFLDPRDPQKRKLIYLLLPVMLLTCALQIQFGVQDKKTTDADRAKLEASIDALRADIEQLANFGWSSQRVANTVAQTSRGKTEISQLTSVQQSYLADAELKKLVPLQSQKQGAVTIEYFPKDVDREKVETALRELGFRLETGVPQFPGVPTNSLWFGSQVPIDDVKRVAYVLIRAGVQLQAIRRFRASVPVKDSQLIQVGSDPQLVGRPPITVEQIRSASDFPHTG